MEKDRLQEEIEELKNFQEFCFEMANEQPKGVVVDNNPSHFTEQAEYCEKRLGKLEATDEPKIGSELDALVAKAIGLWEEGGQWYGKHPHTEGAKAYASVCLPIPLFGISYDNRNGLPKFSSDYTAAFALFVLATEGFGGVGMYSDMEDWGEEHPVCVEILGHTILWRPFPEAMCLAFLKAAEEVKD